MQTSGDEVELIQRAKDGNSVAFGEIYNRFQPAIYRYIFYRVGAVAEAEDLTSEVFLRMVQRIDGFTFRGRPLLAWLYTIARNLVRDHDRRVRSRVSIPLHQGIVADVPSPEDEGERALTQRRLAKAMRGLTEDQQEVILLKFIEGLDNQTVALTLGKSVGAVKSLQHRALASLRRILGPDSG